MEQNIVGRIKARLWQHTGETLLETLIGLVIIGMVLLCLPMAISVTAEMNETVAVETDRMNLTMTEGEQKEATVTVECVANNVSREEIRQQDGTMAYPYIIPDQSGSMEDSYDSAKTGYVTGYMENGFYYYRFSLEE